MVKNKTLDELSKELGMHNVAIRYFCQTFEINWFPHFIKNKKGWIHGFVSYQEISDEFYEFFLST